MGLARDPTVGTASARPLNTPSEHRGLLVWNSASRLCENGKYGQKIQSHRMIDALGKGDLRLDCVHLQAVKYQNPADFVGKPGKTS